MSLLVGVDSREWGTSNKREELPNRGSEMVGGPYEMVITFLTRSQNAQQREEAGKKERENKTMNSHEKTGTQPRKVWPEFGVGGVLFSPTNDP